MWVPSREKIEVQVTNQDLSLASLNDQLNIMHPVVQSYIYHKPILLMVCYPTTQETLTELFTTCYITKTISTFPIKWTHLYLSTSWYPSCQQFHLPKKNYLRRLTKIHVHFLLNRLTPRSDEHKTSPYNIHTLFSKQVMRIFKLIR